MQHAIATGVGVDKDLDIADEIYNHQIAGAIEVVRVLPKTDLQTLDIILHKIEDQWIVKDMAVYLTKWEKRFPDLFK